ncbi:histidinol-phosphate transaminase [soil metagenome]
MSGRGDVRDVAGADRAEPVLPRARDDLASISSYRTQQSLAEVRLQANEWAEPNPASHYVSAEELDAVLLNRYPTAAADLRGALAQRWGVEADQIILCNGSNEVLLNTFLVFGGHGRTTLLFQPTYSMHARLATIAGGSVADEQVGPPYALDAARTVAVVERTRPDVVVFCTPNNPTGGLVPDDAILAAAERAPQALVLVDEAYAEFSGTTILPALADHPNIVVSKTFSKARAAAGLRLGVLIADARLAERYRAVQLPYNVGVLTQLVALHIAQDDDGVERRVASLRAERERVYRALQGTPAVEAFPSEANFVLFRVRDGDGAAAHARLLAEGVLVRDISAWPGCERCLRVTIGTPQENDRFIAALAAAFPRKAPE